MIKLFSEWFNEGYEDKNHLSINCLFDLLGNIDDPEIKIRVGSLVGILKLVFYGVLDFRGNDTPRSENSKNMLKITGLEEEDLNEEYKADLITGLLNFLCKSEQRNCQYSLYVIFEILMLMGKHPLFFQRKNLDIVTNILMNYEEPEVRKKIVKFLFGIDWAGLMALLSICDSDRISASETYPQNFVKKCLYFSSSFEKKQCTF
jgi:hypothetical protein